MEKQHVVYPYTRILPAHKKECHTASCYNMDDRWRHYAKWKKSVTKDNCRIPFDLRGNASTMRKTLCITGWDLQRMGNSRHRLWEKPGSDLPHPGTHRTVRLLVSREGMVLRWWKYEEARELNLGRNHPCHNKKHHQETTPSQIAPVVNPDSG